MGKCYFPRQYGIATRHVPVLHFNLHSHAKLFGADQGPRYAQQFADGEHFVEIEILHIAFAHRIARTSPKPASVPSAAVTHLAVLLIRPTPESSIIFASGIGSSPSHRGATHVVHSAACT